MTLYYFLCFCMFEYGNAILNYGNVWINMLKYEIDGGRMEQTPKKGIRMELARLVSQMSYEKQKEGLLWLLKLRCCMCV